MNINEYHNAIKILCNIPSYSKYFSLSQAHLHAHAHAHKQTQTLKNWS